MCVVHGDFDNLQESPAGFGEGVLGALQSLRDDLVAEKREVAGRIASVDDMIDAILREQGCSDMDITCKRASREVATWPPWKQNILVQSGKPTVDTPRTPIPSDDTAGVY